MCAAPILLPADPDVARHGRTLLLTFAIASWCSVVLGIREVNVLLVVVFAWASTAVLRLSATPSERVAAVSLWSVEFATRAAIGIGLWIVLPGLRVSFPEWWVWHPLVVPGEMSAAGATVALCWPLRPFWLHVPASESNRTASSGDGVETLLLSCSLFFVSGSPIFAMVTVVCVLSRLTRTVRSRRLAPALSISSAEYSAP